MRRRALLLLGAATGLAGCGFHPLYAPAASGTLGAAQAKLAAIDVPVIPDRSGQLMRQALQARLYGPGIAEAKQYRLTVDFSIANEGIAIQPDNSTARQRMTGFGRWTLYALDPGPRVLTTGFTRTLDGLNPIDNQPFASDEETETVTRRIAQNLADQIVLQLATYFDRQAREGRRSAMRDGPLGS
jgi:LPS-assembly lipoprotein